MGRSSRMEEGRLPDSKALGEEANSRKAGKAKAKEKEEMKKKIPKRFLTFDVYEQIGWEWLKLAKGKSVLAMIGALEAMLIKLMNLLTDRGILDEADKRIVLNRGVDIGYSIDQLLKDKELLKLLHGK